MTPIEKSFTLIKYVLLGIIQGLTEPLPISSSGHVVIIRELLSIETPGLSFEIIVNFGSLLAIIYVYRKTIFQLTRQSLIYIFHRSSHAKNDFKFVLLILIATVPIGITGLLLKDFIFEDLSTIEMTGFALILTGIFLWSIRQLTGHKEIKHVSIKDAIIIGCAQMLALIPGISRSGVTIVAAMLVGLKRNTALRFSFLLYIPVSLGVTILSVKDILDDPNIYTVLIPYIIALMTAALATYFALKWFIRIMMSGKLIYFTYYCSIAGVLIVLFSI